MTDDNFDTKLRELVHDNGPSDGLVEEILRDKNVGIPGMGSQLANYSKIAKIMYYLTYQFTNVNSDAVGKKYQDEIFFSWTSLPRLQIKKTDVGEIFLDKLVSLSNRGKEIEPNLRKKYLELYNYLRMALPDKKIRYREYIGMAIEALEQESIDTTWDNIKVWLKQNKGLEITRALNKTLKKKLRGFKRTGEKYTKRLKGGKRRSTRRKKKNRKKRTKKKARSKRRKRKKTKRRRKY